MQHIIIYLVKSSVCIAIFWMVYCVCFKKETFFRYIRFYLLSGMIASIVIPFIHFTYEVKIRSYGSPLLPQPINEPPLEIAYSGYYIWEILVIIYLTGVVFLLVKRFADYSKFYRIVKGGVTIKGKGYSVIENHEISSPFSLMKYIVINTSGISMAEKEIILKHEKSHICQKHWFDLVICEIITVIQWFNPLVWKYVVCVKENHEYMVDQALLDSGVPAATYREVLVNQIFGRQIFKFSNSFIYSNNSKRLIMMSKARSSVWKKALVLALLPMFGVYVWASARPEQVKEASEAVVIGGKSMTNPLFIIDGKESPASEMNSLPPDRIESVHVYKGKEAVLKYGKKGENGVIVVKKKPETGAPVEYPLIIIDGKTSTEEEFKALPVDLIESLRVLKNEETKPYGEAARNGVLVVKTKKNKK